MGDSGDRAGYRHDEKGIQLVCHPLCLWYLHQPSRWRIFPKVDGLRG